MKDTKPVISEGAVRLRCLALKSVLGFGQYPLFTVQEIINLGDHQYLLWIYYHSSNIDFNEEIKKILCITAEKEIKKPGKDSVPFFKFRDGMLKEINQSLSMEEKSGTRKVRERMKKDTSISRTKKVWIANLKTNNRDRNQKHRLY